MITTSAIAMTKRFSKTFSEFRASVMFYIKHCKSCFISITPSEDNYHFRARIIQTKECLNCLEVEQTENGLKQKRSYFRTDGSNNSCPKCGSAMSVCIVPSEPLNNIIRNFT